MPTSDICANDNCGDTAWSSGYCDRHYPRTARTRTHRVIVAGVRDAVDNDDIGLYVLTPNPYEPAAAGAPPAEFTDYSDAEVCASRFRSFFLGSTYSVVSRYDDASESWDDIANNVRRARGLAPRPRPASEFGLNGNGSAAAVDVSDDEPCDECGHTGCDEYHEYFSCEECGWGCGELDCEDCTPYYAFYGMRLCADCEYEEERRRAGGTGSAGARVRLCTCCESDRRRVHHDDVDETYLCDRAARERIDAGYPVTTAHPLAAVA